MRIEALETGVVIVTVLGSATVVIFLPGGLGAVVTEALELGAAGVTTVDRLAMTSSSRRWEQVTACKTEKQLEQETMKLNEDAGSMVHVLQRIAQDVDANFKYFIFARLATGGMRSAEDLELV